MIDHFWYRTGVPYFCTVKPLRTHRYWSFSILGIWTNYSPTKLPTVHHRAAHVLPIYGDTQIPDNVSHHNSLDAFVGFYINKYADRHAFEIAY